MENTAMRTKYDQLERYVISLLAHIPVLSYYIRSRGWSFILSWVHRIAGIILVLYLFAHVYTLYGLSDPKVFANTMEFYNNVLFIFLEWAIAIPLIFHALNGTRLIFYEIFEVRDDSAMIRWLSALSAVYMLVLGYLMILGNQHVSLEFFWLTILILSILAGYIVYRKLWRTNNHFLWKAQRVSGAFLLPMLLGHMYFMHMSHTAGHDANTVILRMQGNFIKGIDLLVIFLMVFHGTYGVYSVIGDYIERGYLRKLLTISMIIIMVICCYAGVKLTISI